METINNPDIYKQIFSAYITDPANLQGSESVNMEVLLKKFPYCQLLHAFNCKIFKDIDPQKFDKLLHNAAIYAPNRKVLYSVINHPESFNSFVPANPTEEKATEPEISDHSDDPKQVVEFAKISNDPENEEDLYIEIIEEEIEEEVPEETVSVTETSRFQKIEIDDEEKILLESIASADFFSFEKKLSRQTTEHAAQRTAPVNPQKFETKNLPADTDSEPSDETQEVSKYDDDQMPYTFLWWLHKTRQDHADTYQPYVNFQLDTSKGIQKTTNEELDHQIKENIFHLQSPLDELEKKNTSPTIHFELRRKEEAIIEKFIREEPQIKPPTPDRLDNENKARKSAEDPNDLVSETLAAIYSEQMLFHKAIDTYKKLSLKFPEKRAYFADQIRELENKLNK